MVIARGAGQVTADVRSFGRVSALDMSDRITMTNIPDNVVQFPLNRRRDMRTCPHCGTCSDVWQLGRLLWGYCDTHEVRWVVADYHTVSPDDLDRNQMRRGLQFLSSFAEVSR